MVGKEEITIFTIVALATIFISSYLITYSHKVFAFIEPALSLFSKEKFRQPEPRKPHHDIWIVGYHRIGWKIGDVLRRKRASYAFIDFNPDTISDLAKEKIPAYYGDVADVDFLDELGLEKSKAVISTIPDIDAQATMIRNLRAANKRLLIIANSPEAKYRDILYEAGADYVMTPHLLGGHWLAQLVNGGKLSRPILAKLKIDQTKEVDMGMPIHHL